MSSLSFNGTSDFARGTPAVTATPLSISCWFYPTSLAATATICGIFASAGDSGFIQQILTTGALRTGSRDSTNATAVADTTNTTTINTWSHGFSSFTSATSRRVILNGDLANSATNSGNRTPTALDRLTIGCNDSQTQGIFFPGPIGEIAIWNVTLSGTEAVALSKGWSPRKIQPQALVFLAPYPGIGTTVWDWLKNPLTITGAVSSTNTPPMIGHP